MAFQTKKRSYPTPADIIPYNDDALAQSISARFEQIVSEAPGNLAVVSDEESLTYRELNARANQVAHRIMALSSPINEPIPFLTGHSAAAVVAILGILKAGKAYVPIDPAFPANRMQEILIDIGADILVTDSKHLSTALSVRKSENDRVIDVDHLKESTAKENPITAHQPDHLAYILYTSGSTGKPKGVMHSHLDAMHNNIVQFEELRFSPSDRFSQFISFGFEAARFSVHGALLSGSRLCLYDIRAQGLRALPIWMRQEKITIMMGIPSTFRQIFTLKGEKNHFPNVRVVNLGGETLTKHDFQLFRRHFPADAIMINTLGMTETGLITRYIIHPEMDVDGYHLPAGTPLGEKQVLLLDENGEPVESGETGEIYMKSRYISPGYWRKPEETREKFTTDPYDPEVRLFRTGDLGLIRPDGALEYLGRKDFQIKIRGFRINLAGIESVILSYNGVRNAAVIARDSEIAPNEKQLVAYVEPVNGADISRHDLREMLTGTLPDYMVPAIIIILDELPLTVTGKVNHQRLPAPEKLQASEEKAKYVEPHDHIESELVRIWEKTLKKHPIGVQDNYFELGGSSLTAAQMFALIEKTFQKKIPLATLFQAPTIKKQAELLRQENWVNEWSSLTPLQPNGEKPPLFFAAPVGGNVLSYRDLLNYLAPDQPCYGLQAIGLDGVQRPHRNMDEIVDHYVKEIKTVQPSGPYYLLGSSFGGIVAYEMAQRLHDLGDKIALVVMFDSYGPNYPRRHPGTSRVKRKVFKYLRRMDTHLSSLAYTDWRGRMAYVQVKGGKLYRRLSQRLKDKTERMINPLPSELRRVRASQYKVAKRRKRKKREPRRFGGRLVLFRATKQPLGIYADPTLGWRAVSEQIEVHEMPGHHTSLIYEPRVHRLAAKLNGIIEEIQRDQSG